MEELTRELEQNGRNIAEDYEAWMKIGFALSAELGESGREYYHRISALSQKYSARETDRKYDQCMNDNRNRIGIGTLFYYAKNR